MFEKPNNDILNELRSNRESHLQMVKEFGAMGATLTDIKRLLDNNAVMENFVLQTYAQTFRSNGYALNSIYVSDAAVTDNAKITIQLDGVSYSTVLAAGENSLNIPDGATYQVTTTSTLPVTAVLYRYNGASGGDKNVTVNSPLPASSNTIGSVRIVDGYNDNVRLTVGVAGDGDGVYNGVYMIPQGELFNGASWDRIRNNTQGTLLASAARTVTTNSPVQTNYNARGIIIFLNVSAASGTGGLQVRIQIIDPVSGNPVNLTSLTTAITAVSTPTYVYYPGTSIGGTQAFNTNLPRIFQVQVVVGDATSYTYSLGYSLLL